MFSVCRPDGKPREEPRRHRKKNGVALVESKGYVRKGMDMASPITTTPGKTVGVNQPPTGAATVSRKRGSKRDGRRKGSKDRSWKPLCGWTERIIPPQQALVRLSVSNGL